MKKGKVPEMKATDIFRQHFDITVHVTLLYDTSILKVVKHYETENKMVKRLHVVTLPVLVTVNCNINNSLRVKNSFGY